MTADVCAVSDPVLSEGVAPTRNDQTEARYWQRFRHLWMQFVAQAAPNRLSLLAYTEWLVGRRSDLSASSFRQYRSASAFAIAERMQEGTLSALEREDGIKALRALQDSQHLIAAGRIDGGARRQVGPKRTSAKKAKSARSDDWDRLMQALAVSRSQYARSVSLLLTAGLFTGLRPSEWANAHLVADPSSATRRLIVFNGKASNGRAHSATRTLTWWQDGPEIDAIVQWLTHLDELLPIQRDSREQAWATLYEAWRNELYQTTRRLWPRRKCHISFYTTRHLFAAEAKLVYERAELAALLGHATDATATMHYARPSRSSRSGCPFTLPAPDPIEIARVRAVFEEREARATYRVRLADDRRNVVPLDFKDP